MAESRSNNNFVHGVTRNGNNNAWQTSIDDCFFFLDSACTRDDCPFRHEPAARFNSVVCTYWKAGHCTRRGCKFRHFDGNGGKRKTKCKWESRPGGCCKPQCPYQHAMAKRSKLSSEPLLPTSLPKMIKHPDLENILVTFFKEYFKVYDSDNRQPLLNAYCENAVMSLHAVGSMEDMEAYIEQSRNLLRATEKQKRQLKIGRLQVVALHASLPGTQHSLKSLTLDEPFKSENNVVNITLTGLFKEKNTGKIRHFNRAMAIVPRGSGLCILNEILFVTFPTKAQMDSCFSNYPSSSDDDSMMSAPEQTF